MESKGRLAKLESLVSQNKGIEPDHLQALVFIAQTFGESYEYSFDVHHLRVFSRALESDIEFLSTQGISADNSKNSEISKLIAKVVLSASTEQAEVAAAFFYFEDKGYSPEDIEKAFNADKSVMSGAKQLISELKKTGKKELAASSIG